MIKRLHTYARDFLHLFFPHYCEGCGSDAVEDKQLLCLQCLAQLPQTGFFGVQGNPVEKTFYGRLPVNAAGAAYYFTDDSLIQHLVTQLKYHGNSHVGVYLGMLTALELSAGARFDTIDCIVPLPLNEKKLQRRGYNQAALIAEGMSQLLGKPVLLRAVTRDVFTDSQTGKDRVSRWQSMRDVFRVNDAGALANKHVLLVDDIITTGATLEACGAVMQQVPGLSLSIASVAWTI
jgi:ComF family protein